MDTWTVQDTINEVIEKYSGVMERLAGNGHTNGCSCLECQFVDYDREMRAAVQKQGAA